MKTFKEFISEEGYDRLRDQGRIRPSKDKKDGTSYPPSAEMRKTQKVNKGPSAFERVKKKYGKSVMKMKEEVELLDEKVGGAGTLVRQGVKVGGKKGGRAVQKGQDAAVKAGQGQKAKAAQGNKKKMVGDGKYERRGAVIGGIAGGVSGGILDGPVVPIGDIVGGIAGSKVGGKIGRQFDKKALKKKMKEEVQLLDEGIRLKTKDEFVKGWKNAAKKIMGTKDKIINQAKENKPGSNKDYSWKNSKGEKPGIDLGLSKNVDITKDGPTKVVKQIAKDKVVTPAKDAIVDAVKKHGVKAGVAGAAAVGGLALAKRLAKKSDDKKDKKESFSNWRDDLSKDHEEINELLGAATVGTLGGWAAGTKKGVELLSKAGIKNKIAQKAVGGAAGAAAGEVLDPTKKAKDKKPLTAAALGGLGGAVAGGGIGAATEKINKEVVPKIQKKLKKEEVEAVDENAGPSTPVSMSGGKLQFNKGGAGIGKIRPKKGGSLAGAPIPKV